jgi:hypothetical protein
VVLPEFGACSSPTNIRRYRQALPENNGGIDGNRSAGKILAILNFSASNSLTHTGKKVRKASKRH